MLNGVSTCGSLANAQLLSQRSRNKHQAHVRTSIPEKLARLAEASLESHTRRVGDGRDTDSTVQSLAHVGASRCKPASSVPQLLIRLRQIVSDVARGQRAATMSGARNSVHRSRDLGLTLLTLLRLLRCVSTETIRGIVAYRPRFCSDEQETSNPDAGAEQGSDLEIGYPGCLLCQFRTFGRCRRSPPASQKRFSSQAWTLFNLVHRSAYHYLQALRVLSSRALLNATLSPGHRSGTPIVRDAFSVPQHERAPGAVRPKSSAVPYWTGLEWKGIEWTG